MESFSSAVTGESGYTLVSLASYAFFLISSFSFLVNLRPVVAVWIPRITKTQVSMIWMATWGNSTRIRLPS